MISVYTFCYNEEILLPYFLRHYSAFADKIVIFDNMSTDGSRSIAEACPIAEVVDWDTGGVMDELGLAGLKSECWKGRRKDEWAFVVDVDEIVHHEDILGTLGRLKDEGVTIVRPEGWDMVSPAPPSGPGQITKEIVRGVPSPLYSKPCVFRPGRLAGINYDVGAHECEPTGDVAWSTDSGIKLLHYHQLGPEFVASKYGMLRARVDVPLARANRWATYETSPEMIGKIGRDFMRDAVRVI